MNENEKQQLAWQVKNKKQIEIPFNKEKNSEVPV